MSDLAERMRRRLAALAGLQVSASGSDLAFYQQAEAKARARLTRAEQPAAPLTAADLRERLDRLHGHAQDLGHELTQPEAIRDSHRFRREQLAGIEDEIAQTEARLRQLEPDGPAYQAPAFDVALYRLQEAHGEAYSARLAAGLMRDLHLAWMEREGVEDPTAQARLAELEQAMNAAQVREAQAQQAVEAHLEQLGSL